MDKHAGRDLVKQLKSGVADLSGKKPFKKTLPRDPEAAGILLFRGTTAALLHLFAAFTREVAVLLFLGFILLFPFPFFFQS